MMHVDIAILAAGWFGPGALAIALVSRKWRGRYGRQPPWRVELLCVATPIPMMLYALTIRRN